MLATIQKWGNSHGIRLPLSILGEAGMIGGEAVVITAEEGQIAINKIKTGNRKNIITLFEGYNEEYQPVDIDWGVPAGKEIW